MSLTCFCVLTKQRIALQQYAEHCIMYLAAFNARLSTRCKHLDGCCMMVWGTPLAGLSLILRAHCAHNHLVVSGALAPSLSVAAAPCSQRQARVFMLAAGPRLDAICSSAHMPILNIALNCCRYPHAGS